MYSRYGTVGSKSFPSIFCAQDAVGAADILVRVFASPEAHKACYRRRRRLEREQLRPG